MTSFCVFSSETFDIVDERSYYNDLYMNIGVELDERLFLINGPFMMDSQFDAMKREGRRIRKRKKSKFASLDSNQNFRKLLAMLFEHMPAICSKYSLKRLAILDKCVLLEEIVVIENISKDIRKTGHRIGYFCDQPVHDNNRTARDAAREIVEQSIQFYNPETISSPEVILLEGNSDFILGREYSMLNSWYKNQSDSIISLNVSLTEGEPATTYYMPPNSTFHVGPVADVTNYAILNGDKFDLIVMDPPWDNLSVKRQQSYVTSDSALSMIDMECLASDGLVAIWTTNRKGIIRDLEVHLKRWKLKRLATFVWLKVTTEGDPVCSFNGSHKLPYEKLVLTSRAEAMASYKSIVEANGKVFASVPMAVPSRKPPVAPMLKQFGINPSRCLELFARCLQPNTVSVGFETLLLQTSSCLVPAKVVVDSQKHV